MVITFRRARVSWRERHARKLDAVYGRCEPAPFGRRGGRRSRAAGRHARLRPRHRGARNRSRTRFMRMAIEEAALGDYPFGAVIVRDGEVLARGRNLGKQEKDPTAHGEMVAIRKFLAAHGPEMLKGTTLYTSGESCPMCMGAVVWCGAASFTGLQSPRLRPRSARSWSPTPRLRPRRRFRTSPSPGAFSPTRR
jgi:hypothetical protein